MGVDLPSACVTLDDRGRSTGGHRWPAMSAGTRCSNCSRSEGRLTVEEAAAVARRLHRHDPARLRPARPAADAHAHPGRRGRPERQLRPPAALQDGPARRREAAHRRAAAAELVSPGAVVGMNGGTTTSELARALATRATDVRRPRLHHRDQRAEHRRRADRPPAHQDRGHRRRRPAAVLRADRPAGRRACSNRSPSTSPSSGWTRSTSSRAPRPTTRARRASTTCSSAGPRRSWWWRTPRRSAAGRSPGSVPIIRIDTLVTDAQLSDEYARHGSPTRASRSSAPDRTASTAVPEALATVGGWRVTCGGTRARAGLSHDGCSG